MSHDPWPLVLEETDRVAEEVFRSIDEVFEWIDDDESNWEWFTPPETGSPAIDFEGQRVTIPAALQGIPERWQEKREKLRADLQGLDPDKPTRLLDIVRGAFSGAAGLIHHRSTRGRFALSLAQAGQFHLMLILLSKHSKLDPSSVPRDGALLEFLFRLHLGSATGPLLGQEAISQKHRDYSEKLSDLYESFRERLNGIIEEHTSAMNSWAENENKLRNQLAFGAPVEFWKSAASSSYKAATIFGALFVTQIVASVVLLLAWVPDRLERIFGQRDVVAPTSPVSQVDVLRLSLLVLASALIFWLIRVSARLLLSSYHQFQDARVRVVQMQAFIALVNEKDVGIEDRNLALAAVFRPANTGIVSDDAAPNWPLAALLSKTK